MLSYIYHMASLDFIIIASSCSLVAGNLCMQVVLGFYFYLCVICNFLQHIFFGSFCSQLDVKLSRYEYTIVKLSFVMIFAWRFLTKEIKKFGVLTPSE